MVRPRPLIFSLRSLFTGLVFAGALTAGSVALVGCADESKPATWLKRLDDPIQRPQAVKRLVQFFEDAMTRANKERNDPQIKALLDEILEPMVKTYTDAPLDDRTRIDLIKFLADTRDPRAKAAWIKACEGFAVGSGPAEDDVRWAAPAIGALKLEDAAEAFGHAFAKLQAGTMKGSQAYKNVHDAMVAMHSPAWKALMLDKLSKPMDRPAGAGDSGKVTAFQNEQFWQTTAAEVLGDLREPSAVKPLFKAILDPNKADVAATAIVALIKIGKDVEPFLFNVLAGKDEDIIDFAKGHSGGNVEEAKGYVRTAAVVLGALGRADAAGPMVAALAAADSDSTRGILGRELTKLTATPDTEKAFGAAFDKIAPNATIPPSGINARSALAEESAHFYDSQLVPWILKELQPKAKKVDGDLKNVRVALLPAAAKVMTKAQVADVKAGLEMAQKADKEALAPVADAFKLAADEINACGDSVACHLSKLQEPGSQEEKTQFTGLKAAYMLGVYGTPATSLEIAKALPKVKNAAVRFAAVTALDHLTQKDTAPVVAALQKIVDDNQAKGDANSIMGDAPVKTVIHRLRAR